MSDWQQEAQRQANGIAFGQKQQTPTINPALYERMEKLVRRCADSAMASGDLYTIREASEIVAMLPEPEPPDPDLVVARSIVARCAHWMMGEDSGPAEQAIMDGKWDKSACGGVQMALAAIKRTRQEMEVKA